jgi:CelD/BcsL family acetyltransferase involved in cellulose biosynthesis
MEIVVDRITDFKKLDAIERSWRRIYASDPYANLFLSWEWMRACFETQRKKWLVLGARKPGNGYLALLPLSVEGFPANGIALNRELSLAGNPRADFTGMLGVAGEEARFIPALAREIERLRWDNFTLADYSDPRIGDLVTHLQGNGYRVAAGEPTPSPYIELPESWEAYVDSRSQATRRTIRAKLRKVESLPGFRFEFAAAEEGDRAIDTLLRINSRRWNMSLRKRRKKFGGLFAQCFTAGRFIITSINVGGVVIASQGSFVDPDTGTIFGYMMGYDADYAKYSPGAMLVCCSIRYAIEHGYRRYDLSRGGEAFKSSLATGLAHTTHATLTRPGMRVAAVNAGRRSFLAVKGAARQLLVRPA